MALAHRPPSGRVELRIEVDAEQLQFTTKAEMVSQKTSEAVLGLPARNFLELVREFARTGGDVVHARKLRLVKVAAFVAWLRRRDRGDADREIKPANDSTPTLEAELGLVAVRGLR